MKATSFLIAALVMVSAVVVAAGKEEPRNVGFAVVPVKGSEIFKVIYKGENTGKVKVNIYGTDLKVIFSETMTSVDGFILPLNFSGLVSGEYTIEVVDANGKRVEKVSYAPQSNVNQVRVSKLASNVHVSKVEESKFLLSVTSKGAEEVSVNIYDEAKNLLHSETKTISGDYAQVYTLKNVKGEVTFVVTDSNGSAKEVTF